MSNGENSHGGCRIDQLNSDQLREVVEKALRQLAVRNRVTIGVAIDNSAGTYRDMDLLRRLQDCLLELDPANAADFEAELEDLQMSTDGGQDQPEVVDELINRLEEAINDHLLDTPYLYFGTHDHYPGLYGFWPDLDSLEEDASLSDPTVIKVGETPEFIAHVNDHGNVTLYRVHLEEVWAVV